MLWPPIVRFALYLLTWKYLEQALTLCIPCLVTWVDIVRGWILLWLIVESGHRDSSRQEIKTAKWKSRNRNSLVFRICGVFGRKIEAATNLLDRAVAWLIGDEPTLKEKLTWTRPRFSIQTRVRKGMSSGQGYNKRNIGTSAWFKTAAAICLVATMSKAEATRFDSDSVVIHVDNCASRCITNSLTDFVRPPQKVIGRVKGMGGDKVAVAAVGTIRWTFDDDDGMSHAFVIPGSLYIPESPARLFSPQHWAQERKDNVPKKNGTWQATFADHVMLVWGQEAYRKRIPFDKANVATFSTTSGCKQFRIFRACLEDADGDQEERESFMAFDATLIVDDEDDEQIPDKQDMSDDESITPIPERGSTTHERSVRDEDDDDDVGYTKTTGHHDTSYEKYKDVATIEDFPEDEFEGRMRPTSEIMLWHNRLGHIPFSRLQTMAKTGLLPRRLSDCRLPKCASCIYGKMTRRAKRTKNEKAKIEARVITGPGSCVSVDQLESRTLGLIGHMKGTPTVQRYRCATIYVDHYSRLSYVHLQKQLTSEETVQGKIAFEKFCEARGVTVKHYHADNGRFADKGFVNHITQSRQSITYCGVNAHFQNGMAEKRIRDLQDQATSMLMHAEAKWPDVITANLWPYALREANETLNSTPSKVTGQVAHQMFAGTEAPPIIRHFHTFGCPTYILDNNLAAGRASRNGTDVLDSGCTWVGRRTTHNR